MQQAAPLGRVQEERRGAQEAPSGHSKDRQVLFWGRWDAWFVPFSNLGWGAPGGRRRILHTPPALGPPLQPGHCHSIFGMAMLKGAGCNCKIAQCAPAVYISYCFYSQYIHLKLVLQPGSPISNDGNPGKQDMIMCCNSMIFGLLNKQRCWIKIKKVKGWSCQFVKLC